MWLIKRPFRIIALPIMAVVGALSIFYRLILEVGLLAIGLIYVILGIGLVNYLIQRNWLQVGIILGIGAIAFVGSMFAQVLATGLEALSGKLVAFVFT